MSVCTDGNVVMDGFKDLVLSLNDKLGAIDVKLTRFESYMERLTEKTSSLESSVNLTTQTASRNGEKIEHLERTVTDTRKQICEIKPHVAALAERKRFWKALCRRFTKIAGLVTVVGGGFYAVLHWFETTATSIKNLLMVWK